MPVYNFIDGYSNPVFHISNAITKTKEIINLDLCDEAGLTKEYELFAIKHDLLDYSTETNWQGFHIHFTLPYSYSDKINTMNIKKLINYILDKNINYVINLQPRIDNINTYEVICTTDKFTLNIMKGGTKAIGNKISELTFRTKYIQTKIDWVDTSTYAIPIQNDFAVI